MYYQNLTVKVHL